MNKELIIIFTRNPELGKVKTRLAKTIGNEAALIIYKYLLDHTEKVISSIAYDKAIYYSEKVREHDIWSNTNYSKHLQQGSDLGKRMHQAFQNGFSSGYNKIIIVGSDLPDLKKHHVETAFKMLDEYDVVIGPAEDGGYYLLGMCILHSQVFESKQWGTSTVLADTLKNLQNENVFLLEELNDIDTFEDLKQYPKLMTLIH